MRTIPAATGLSFALSALVVGYYEGLSQTPFPPHLYEFHQALAIGLSQPDLEAQLHRGEDPLLPALVHRAEDLPELLGTAAEG